MNNIDNILEFIKGSNDFIVTSHINPDGDNIGSTLGTYYFLKKLGKKVYYILDDFIPSNLSFLVKDIEILKSTDINIKDYNIIALDCGDKKRICISEDLIENSNKLICIDHHTSNDYYGDLNYIDENASSTSELVYNLISRYNTLHNEDTVDEKIATALYTGLITDTGNFMYSNTQCTSFDMAKELLFKKANKDLIIKEVFQSNKFDYYKLLGESLNTLDIYENKIATITVTMDMMKRNNLTFNDVDGIVSYARDIEGVEVGILIKEKEEGEVKISLRSKTYVDVSEIAKSLNGGGHKKASGCTIYDNVENAKNIVLKAVLEKI